jgi:hypothetical protein
MMAERTVLVFGAGATKAYGGPLKNEILRLAHERRGEIEGTQSRGANWLTSRLEDGRYKEQENSTQSLEHRYSCKSGPCADRDCGTPVRPVLITPIYMKHYRNPQVSRIWYKAALALKGAERVHIIGYSIPIDDVDVSIF